MIMRSFLYWGRRRCALFAQSFADETPFSAPDDLPKTPEAEPSKPLPAEPTELSEAVRPAEPTVPVAPEGTGEAEEPPETKKNGRFATSIVLLAISTVLFFLFVCNAALIFSVSANTAGDLGSALGVALAYVIFIASLVIIGAGTLAVSVAGLSVSAAALKKAEPARKVYYRVAVAADAVFIVATVALFVAVLAALNRPA